MKNKINFVTCAPRQLLLTMSILLLIFSQIQPAWAVSLSDSSHPVPSAVMKLVAFCTNPKTGLDTQAIDTIIDYVLEPKPIREGALPKFEDTTGAYYEYDTRINFPAFLQYSYNSKIPSTLLSPSSLRYSVWKDLPGEAQKLPGAWKSIAPSGKPVVIFGLERDCITPDLTTGIYYEYNLKRTLILLNHKGRQVLISISKQIDQSDVGKKGFILANDEDWHYYYSGEPGVAKPGLGWVKSYIYSFFSVGVYADFGSSPAMTRTGVFQWLRAGWSGMNFVKPEHVIKGMKRHAKNLNTILESPRLPAPSQVIAAYQELSTLPHNDLALKYAALQQARQGLAVRNGKIATSDTKKTDPDAHAPKEQIIEELMQEYLKIALGKASLVGKKIFLGCADQSFISLK